MATSSGPQLIPSASDATSSIGPVNVCEHGDESQRIRIMTWNIDGCHSEHIKHKTRGVCETITAANPHVVFLQEVVKRSERLLSKNFPAYRLISGYENIHFYTAIMVRTDVVEVDDTVIIPFKTSQMGSNVLAVKCKIKGEKFYLITSHFESKKVNSKERTNQLLWTLTHMMQADQDRTVLFGGDQNLRDEELLAIGGLSGGIKDVWEMLGSQEETKYTWDTTTNDNLAWHHPLKYKPKLRFERVYIKHPWKQAIVEPISFELTGKTRLQSCHLFPSDHWAVVCQFNILPRRAA